MPMTDETVARITDISLREATIAVRRRTEGIRRQDSPRVGLRLVCFDCININWAGIHTVMRSNGSATSHGQVIHLKCYFGWQQTVDQHLRLILRGDIATAKWLEDRWVDHMMCNDDMTVGTRRRRRRAREVALFDIDGTTSEVRRRRRTGGCVVM